MRLGVGLCGASLDFVANPALFHPANAPFGALLAFAKTGAGLWRVSFGLIGAGEFLHSRAVALTARLVAIFAAGVGG
jgi:hypothetical protein